MHHDTLHSFLQLDKVSNVAVALRMLQLMVYLLPMAFFFPLAYISDKWDEIWCRMLKRILERMGPCFIKLGMNSATFHCVAPPPPFRSQPLSVPVITSWAPCLVSTIFSTFSPLFVVLCGLMGTFS